MWEGKVTFRELEELAYQNQAMPNHLDVYMQAVYQSLRCLYSHYRHGEINRDLASREKKAIRITCEERMRVNDFHANLSKHCSELWSAIGGAAAEYRKNRTLESADKLLEAIYGVGIPGGEEL